MTSKKTLLIGLTSLTMSLAYGLGGEGAITHVDPNVAITDITPLTEYQVPGKPPVQGGEHEFFQGSGANVGVWEGGPGIARIQSYPYDEFWRVLEGSIVFTETSGKSYTFKAGDMFVLHKGFSGTARLPGKMRKLYVSLARDPHSK